MRTITRESPREAWLDSATALLRIHELGGIRLSLHQLLELCVAERCVAHLDCSFAAGPAPADQLFVRRIKGAGRCELLVADALCVAAPAAGMPPQLCAGGTLLVRGRAWVYAGDRQRPVLLRADARTPHQAVVTAMDALGQLGFRRISIATAPDAAAAP